MDTIFKIFLLTILGFNFSIIINAQCGLELIVVDACAPENTLEANNEYFVFTAQSNIVASDVSISVSCPDGSVNAATTMGVANTTGFVNLMNSAMSAICGNGVFVDGTSGIIPAGSKVMAFPCPSPHDYLTTVIDYTIFCGSPNIYIIFGGSNCNTPYFKNNSNCTSCGCIRYIDIFIDNCLAEINYDITQMYDQDGAYIYPGVNPDNPNYSPGSGCVAVEPCTPPTLSSITITGCAAALSSYDLTTHQQTIYASTIADYKWYHGDPNNGGTLITDATSVDLSNLSNGLYISVAVDGCSAQLNINITVSPSPTFSVTGGGILCGTTCREVDWVITGGTPSYEISYSIHGPGGIVIYSSSFISSLATGSMTVCFDNSIAFPTFNASTNVLTVNNLVGTNFSIEFTEVEDSGGCSSSLTGQSVSFSIGTPPTVNTPQPIVLCDTDPNSNIMTVDLSNYNSLINSTATIKWFEDAAAAMQVINTSVLVSGSVTYYAIATDGTCDSDVVALQITIKNKPVFNNPGNINQCNPYTLPSISGTNFYGNEAYYTQSGGLGAAVSAGTVISTPGTYTYYMYGGDGTCVTEDIFTVTIASGPSISPISPVIICDQYILPAILGTGLDGSEVYHTSTNGGGTTYYPGDLITSSTTLYAYINMGGCISEESFNVIIEHTPTIDQPGDLNGCGQLVLPAIVTNPSTTTGVYQINGSEYSAGDIVTQSGTYTIYVDVPNSACDAAQNIEITLTPSATMVGVENLEACDSIQLPVISVTPLNNPRYFSGSLGTGTEFLIGDWIYESMVLYAFDSEPGNVDCYSQEQFTVTINQSPDAGEGISGSVCDGSTVELRNFISPLPDVLPEGTFATSEGAIIENTNGVFLDISNLSSQIDVTYTVTNNCGVDETSFTLTVVSEINAGNDNDTLVCDTDVINLLDLIDGDLGGILYNSSGVDIGTAISLDSINASSYQILYSIQGSTTCPGDDATLNLNISPTPSFPYLKDTTVCNQYDLPPIIVEHGSSSVFYTTQIFGMGDTIPVHTNITESVTLYLFDEVNNCSNIDSISIKINETIERDTTLYLCESDTAVIGSSIYHHLDNDGIEILNSTNGCDSIINVFVHSVLNDTTYINKTLCNGQSITIEGILFDENNLNGEISVIPVGEHKCDSILLVQLTYEDFTVNDNYVDYKICNNEFVIIGGITYGDGNLTDTITYTSSTGCDSFVYIDLMLYPVIEGNYTPEICENESIQYNGTFYDANNPTGQERLFGQAAHGCDSIVNVSVQLLPLETETIAVDLCDGEEYIYNGTIYNSDNQSGEEYINVDGIGCDSVVEINMNILPISDYYIDDIICAGDDIIVNGTVYDVNNLTGIETVSNGSANGCDSIIFVELQLDNQNVKLIDGKFCPGFEIEVDGVIYNESNPTANITIDKPNSPCDSLVVINLEFYTVEEGQIEETICEGGSITINGIIYDVNNSLGEFVSITNNGCDSVTSVSINFEPVVTDFTLIQPNCEDTTSTLTIENVSFEGNPYKIEINDQGVQTIEIPTTLTLDESGEISVVITGDYGCTAQETFVIEEIETVNNPLPSTVEIQSGTEFELNVDIPENAVIMWSPSEGLSCTTCPNPIASPTETTTYTYVVITDDGCEYSGTIQIRILEKSDVFYVPNSFSPNGDGSNEIFGVYSSDDYLYDLLIFDRWGDKVAEIDGLTTNKSTQGWNGTFKTRDLNTGIYVYIAKIYKLNEPSEVKEVLKGNIFLSR